MRIEICGNIASGKTTLCQRMAKTGCFPLYENFQNNPFFEDFYEDPVAFSFETEITFLLQHYNLIKKQKTDTLLVCDYSLLLDMAYADVNLSGNRHRIFFDIVAELQQEIGPPARIIQLVCPEQVLLERIIQRSRDAENSITIAYLSSLHKALTLRVKEFSSQVPTLTVDSHAIDFRFGIDGIPELQSIVS